MADASPDREETRSLQRWHSTEEAQHRGGTQPHRHGARSNQCRGMKVAGVATPQEDLQGPAPVHGTACVCVLLTPVEKQAGLVLVTTSPSPSRGGWARGRCPV